MKKSAIVLWTIPGLLSLLLAGCATTLHDAAKQGNAVEVRHRLQAGEDVNAKDKYGETPLMRAAAFSQMEVIKLLVDKGADVNAQCKYGTTPLACAARSGNMEAVRLLVDKGAEVNPKGEIGRTPLMECGGLSLPQTNIARWLVDKGANVNARDEVGRTPLMCAVFSGTWQAASQMDKGSMDLVKQVRLDVYEFVKLLVDKGADVNAHDRFGQTALWNAAKSGQLEVVTLLVERGADVNAQHEDGRTTLAVAAEGGHEDVVSFLKQHGARK